MWEILLAFCGATFFLALSPGPDNIFVLTLSLTHGFRYGLATIAGLMTGCFIHATYVAFGLTALMLKWPGIIYGIQWFGAAYLFYLAIQVYRSPSDFKQATVQQKVPKLWAMYKKGFLMNVLNPKVSLFFIAFFRAFCFRNPGLSGRRFICSPPYSFWFPVGFLVELRWLEVFFRPTCLQSQGWVGL